MKIFPTWLNLIIFAFILIVFLVILDVVEVPSFAGFETIQIIIVTTFLCGIVIWILYGLYKFREYEASLKEELHITETDSKDKVLYLRPFRTDNKRIEVLEYKGRKYRGSEAVICQAMRELGIPYAIKSTRDKLDGEDVLLPGSAKRVKGGSNWQNTVKSLMESSLLVVIYVDFSRGKGWKTSGTMWEVKTALESCKDKLILLPRLYHRNIGWIRYLLSLEAFVILYPLFSVRVNYFFLSKSRRGYSYYRKWNEQFKEHISPIDMRDMNDRVSAVVFEHNKPLMFKAKVPTIEAQMEAIVDSIQYKKYKK